jgi:hypothetical protein
MPQLGRSAQQRNVFDRDPIAAVGDADEVDAGPRDIELDPGPREA